MKKLKILLTMTAMLGLLAFSGSTLAAKPPGAGGGGGGSPRGGGETPPDYGDLFVLYRDGNGVPYVTDEVSVLDPETGDELDGGMCQQPLPSPTCPLTCKVVGQTWINDVEIFVTQTTDVVRVDEATCGVPAECAICTQEVEFERDNVIRAKESVLDQQLQDATIKLATADCVTLDPAGRPVATSNNVSSAIDSPLQNLAFYKQLMKYGFVGSDPPDNIDLRADDYLLSAARALGASASKEGKIGVDMVVYMNEILGLTDGESLLDLKSQVVREEVKGVMTEVTKSFLDYSGYVYNRANNFKGLPAPAYMPPVGPKVEFFEYVVRVIEDDGSISYEPVYGPILNAVFPIPGGIEETLLDAFAQAADDTRAVINFMHSYPVLDEDVTPIPCGGSTTPEFYDISISEESGLQVPMRMAAAGDGREGSVTVDNGGPADASNVLVTLSGEYEDADGNTKYVVLFTKMGGEPIFENDEEISEIMSGYSETITFFFEMEEATEINWTATAYGEHDANDANDSVEGLTIVKKPKGGGGGGH